VLWLAWSLKGLTLTWLGEAQAAIFHAEQAAAMPALGPEPPGGIR
jgi:hypothetical protein